MTGFVLAQSNFSVQTMKPPVVMKHLEITIDHWNEPIINEKTGIAYPDSFKITQSIKYRAYLYDEDGKLVRTDITQGNLLPYMTSAEIQGIQAFLDNMATKAKGLVP